jgi:hypothetical protein
LLPGIAATVKAAKARGLSLAVASRPDESRWLGTEKFELLDQFDAVCTRDQVSAVKPDPALYLPHWRGSMTASERSRSRFSQWHSRRQARGIFCIAILNSLAQLSLDLADRLLSSLEDSISTDCRKSRQSSVVGRQSSVDSRRSTVVILARLCTTRERSCGHCSSRRP